MCAVLEYVDGWSRRWTVTKHICFTVLYFLAYESCVCHTRSSRHNCTFDSDTFY